MLSSQPNFYKPSQIITNMVLPVAPVNMPQICLYNSLKKCILRPFNTILCQFGQAGPVGTSIHFYTTQAEKGKMTRMKEYHDINPNIL